MRRLESEHWNFSQCYSLSIDFEYCHVFSGGTFPQKAQHHDSRHTLLEVRFEVKRNCVGAGKEYGIQESDANEALQALRQILWRFKKLQVFFCRSGLNTKERETLRKTQKQLGALESETLSKSSAYRARNSNTMCCWTESAARTWLLTKAFSVQL